VRTLLAKNGPRGNVARRLGGLCALAVIIAAPMVRAADKAPAEEWGFYGHDAGGQRFSPLRQVNQTNVASLKLAWTFHMGDMVDGSDGPRSGLETTPLFIDGRLYLTTPFNRVIALDPVSGRQLWAFDPKIDRRSWYGDGLVNRGMPPVSFACSKRHWTPVWRRWTRPVVSSVLNSERTAKSACATSPIIGPAPIT